MVRGVSFLLSASIITLSSSSALGSTLIGSELGLRVEAQSSPTSELFVISFPTSAIVSESTVEFPSIQSLNNPIANRPPGFGSNLVNTSIDAGADFLEINFDTAGVGSFGSAFKNGYAFTFADSIASQIQNVFIDTQTTLGLTPDRVIFNGSELFVNVAGLQYNNVSTFARLNVNFITSQPPQSVPESSTVAGLAALGILSSLGFAKRKLLSQRTGAGKMSIQSETYART